MWVIYCPYCLIEIAASTREGAIAIWNRRPTDQLSSKALELETTIRLYFRSAKVLDPLSPATETERNRAAVEKAASLAKLRELLPDLDI